MDWSHFIYFALTAMLFWVSGTFAAYRNRQSAAITACVIGIAVFGFYIAQIWTALGRPPLRTMGETRMWYSMFIALIGTAAYCRWRYSWILTFSTVMAGVFIGINIANQELFDTRLTPALQSPWFVPHVVVYIFAYAMIGMGVIAGIYSLWTADRRHSPGIDICDNLTGIGTAFMTLGMIFGALWAKDAWGHCWTWDPKETWAAATWLTCLTAIHLKHGYTGKRRTRVVVLAIAFVILQMCWWGINYLPAAQKSSLHVYGMAG